MILKVFSIYDVKAEAYSPPFVEKTIGLAIRTFQALANDMNTNVGKYPGDFTLFSVGEFDDSNGSLIAYDANRPHGTGLEHLKDPSEQWLSSDPRNAHPSTGIDLPV